MAIFILYKCDENLAHRPKSIIANEVTVKKSNCKLGNSLLAMHAV